MLRKKINYQNITRYLFCAESTIEDEIYTDNNFLSKNINIKDLSQFTVLVLVTEHMELSSATKTREFLLNKSYVNRNYKKLTDYISNNNKEKVFLFYSEIKCMNMENLINICGYGNLVLLVNGELTEELLYALCQIFLNEKCIISYESIADKIIKLYKKLGLIKIIKYILHYTTQCQIGINVFTNYSIGVVVNSFDVVSS